MMGPQFPNNFGLVMQQAFGAEYKVIIHQPDDTPPMKRLIKKRRLNMHRSIAEIIDETTSDITRGVTTRYTIEQTTENFSVSRQLFR